jgi:hypothetical protein
MKYFTSFCVTETFAEKLIEILMIEGGEKKEKIVKPAIMEMKNFSFSYFSV